MGNILDTFYNTLLDVNSTENTPLMRHGSTEKKHKKIAQKNKEEKITFISLDSKRWKFVEKSLMSDVFCQSAEAEYIKKYTINLRIEALNKLSEKQLIRIIRYNYQNMTMGEIAKLEGVSEQAIQKSINCTINLLKKLVE